ncbi:MAG: hypothetical protein EHM48_06350 [Planctomycetaceae bacterium]|nr:MAG: hypothetical protein EHM48_06350 [Planctomycetaceae bacterium]
MAGSLQNDVPEHDPHAAARTVSQETSIPICQSSRPPSRFAGIFWHIAGPSGKGLILFTIFLISALVSLCCYKTALGALFGILPMLVGLGFFCVGAYWWARRVGREGYSVLMHMFVPFYAIYFSCKNLSLVREPLYCILRGLILIIMSVASTAMAQNYDKEKTSATNAHQIPQAPPAQQPQKFIVRGRDSITPVSPANPKAPPVSKKNVK